MADDQQRFGIAVLGGDTVATHGPACFSLTIIGTVPPGQALHRRGARIGDDVWVSGSIGDGALGLRVLQGKLTGAADGHLARRYRLPEPRLALGQALRGVARAAMDVSDGLVQDLGHLCRAAGCGAEINADAIPLSAAARAALAADAALLPLILTGGDDYELLFAAAPEDAEAVQAASIKAGVPVARLGRFIAGEGVVVRDASGAAITLPQGGWSHF